MNAPSSSSTQRNSNMSGSVAAATFAPVLSDHSTPNDAQIQSNTTHGRRLRQHPASSSLRLSRQNSTPFNASPSAADMTAPSTFPIDPTLGGSLSTADAATSPIAANPSLAASMPQPPTTPFQNTSNRRPSSSDDVPCMNPAPTAPFQTDFQHQSPTEYSAYDTSFGTDDQGTPATIPVFQNASTTSATDPDSQELRRLAFSTLTESIENLATRTRSEENTANGEKAKQIFGMSWLMRNCEVTTGATPRNRVYARYVSICAIERLKPLNPASFGKLVRAVYPDIKTRRLGVRGQSKYHYCGIKLHDDDPVVGTPDISNDVDETIKPSSVVPSAIQTSATPTAMPTSDHDDTSHWLPRVRRAPLRFVSFSAAQENSKSSSDNFQIPDMSPYIPEGMDEDAVNTLTALYITHSTALIEAIRYVKMNLISGFYGSLTAPVQRVLNSPSLAPWVQNADFAMYKEITRILSPLALQVVPPTILNSLRSLSTTLPDHIRTTFVNHPPHLLRAKLIPASAFARLLARLIRVNDTAHAAARFLANPADRELMRSDWLRFVSPRLIVQRELPCGDALAEQILREEIVSLLSPEQPRLNGGASHPDGVPRVVPRKRLRMDVAGGNSLPPTFSEFESTAAIEAAELEAVPGEDETLLNSDGANMTQGVLDQWAMWLCDLPERFPNVPPRVFLWCIESVGAGALRDITVAGGEGFGAWWVVRCWMDEWMGWIADKGGFLDMDSGTELAGEILHNGLQPSSGQSRTPWED